jgi:hypothetical protein
VSRTRLIQVSLSTQPLDQHRLTCFRPSHSGYKKCQSCASNSPPPSPFPHVCLQDTLEGELLDLWFMAVRNLGYTSIQYRCNGGRVGGGGDTVGYLFIDCTNYRLNSSHFATKKQSSRFSVKTCSRPVLAGGARKFFFTGSRTPSQRP